MPITNVAQSQQYVGEPEAAGIIGVKRDTLRCWRSQSRQGRWRGPKFIKVGRLIRYRVSDLHRWMELRTEG
jgi:predicted DNA-binding transcriptional regulator AlpA